MDASTRASLDKHLIAAYALLYRTSAKGLFEVMPGWVRGFSGLQLPIANIFLPRTPAGLTEDVLADTAAFFSSWNVLYAIELVHDVIPEGPDFLAERRYQSLPPQPAMALQDLSIQLQVNAEVKIEPVATVPDLTAYVILLQEIFDFPARDMLALHPVSQLKEDRIQHYLAFIDDQPVGAGTAIRAEAALSIWNLCTLDQFRRQGVATTMVQRMIADAVKHDCRLAVLYSTAQAYPLFSRLGFEIYTQRQWFLPPGIDYEE